MDAVNATFKSIEKGGMHMIDEQMMRLALQLAKSAAGQTSPNPIVGAVCVQHGQVVGTGAHLQAGTPHAEVHALQMAGERAEGADLYVTLEPCAHEGRTPPCTTRIIESGVKRVIIATTDPNPAVQGRGIARLKAAGIDVVEQVLQEEATFLNRAFFHYIKYGIPYVTLKAATTLDGRLASTTGDSQWISSESSRRDVHLLRHTHDAILVGSETVLTDNPFLTTRLPHGGKNPIRIILDRQLRTPATANVVTDGAAETIIFTTESSEKGAHLSAYSNVSIESISKERPFLQTVLQRLATRGMMTLFVEGGSRIHSSFIDDGLADELILYMAPKMLGNGATIFEQENMHFIRDSRQLRFLQTTMIGPDVKIHAQFVKEGRISCLQEL